MSELTKEWLLKTIAELEEERDATPGAVNEDAAMALAAMKLALASLEAEPAIHRWRRVTFEPYGPYPWHYGNFIGFSKPVDGIEDEYYYAAPPAPVSVPAAMEMDDDFDSAFEHGKAVGWNAYRAAMLQSFGNSEQLNSPAIPDGWVACSERMPDIGTEIFYFCQDDGLRDCGIVSSSNFSGKGDAQLYVHAEGYDLRFGVDITHWMPMPATPQQEADNG
ncbi:DUF551 domain-containing protein [Enterobacter hormaechei]|uniref:DUF551 domain-containing protein n=1 Tax=Enterobacter hormaechei TaxID=158836 RepID=UPI002FF345DE